MATDFILLLFVLSTSRGPGAVGRVPKAGPTGAETAGSRFVVYILLLRFVVYIWFMVHCYYVLLSIRIGTILVASDWRTVLVNGATAVQDDIHEPLWTSKDQMVASRILDR